MQWDKDPRDDYGLEPEMEFIQKLTPRHLLGVNLVTTLTSGFFAGELAASSTKESLLLPALAVAALGPLAGFAAGSAMELFQHAKKEIARRSPALNAARAILRPLISMTAFQAAAGALFSVADHCSRHADIPHKVATVYVAGFAVAAACMALRPANKILSSIAPDARP